MSVTDCSNCGDIYDTDFELQVNELGDCICDSCWEEKCSECDCCGEEQVCRQVVYMGIDTNVCYHCSKEKKC